MRVLFITQSKVSDVVISTVVLDRILAAHPDATIDVAAEKRVTDLFEHMPNLGRLHFFKDEQGARGSFRIWRKFVGTSYDLIIDLRGTAARHFLRAKRTVTFSPDPKRRIAEQLCKLFPLNEERPPQQVLWADEHLAGKIKQYTQGRGIMMGLAPGSSWLAKSWPQRYFAEVVNHIPTIPGFEDVTFVIFGTRKEEHLIQDLIKHIPEERCINLVGVTSLSEAFAWMSHLHGFLGNDCGSSHMAAAADIPVMTLFGPTSELTRAPLARRARTVSAPLRDRSDVNLPLTALPRVMTDIPPEHVIQEIVDMVNQLKQERHNA